jgi:hypothetical protein
MAPDVASENTWFKSSHSAENGTACVEIADLTSAGQVGIRDSKDKSGPALVIPAAAWAAFVSDVQSGLLDHGLVD